MTGVGIYSNNYLPRNIILYIAGICPPSRNAGADGDSQAQKIHNVIILPGTKTFVEDS